MTTRKKKTAAEKKTAAPVAASDLVELEAEIVEKREALNDAVGRYNYALEQAKLAQVAG